MIRRSDARRAVPARAEPDGGTEEKVPTGSDVETEFGSGTGTETRTHCS